MLDESLEGRVICFSSKNENYIFLDGGSISELYSLECFNF
jgi:hypothetical protein